jgi:hypothetical protein
LNVCGSHRLEHAGELIGTLDFILRLLIAASWAKAQLRNNPDLQAAYRAAIEDRADALADNIIALADSEPPAHLEGPALSAWVQQLKLRVHAREWTAAKLRPRVYGEKLDVSVQHTQISVLAALERAEQRVITLA